MCGTHSEVCGGLAKAPLRNHFEAAHKPMILGHAQQHSAYTRVAYPAHFGWWFFCHWSVRAPGRGGGGVRGSLPSLPVESSVT